MSVQSEDSRIQYTGNGSTVIAYTVPFNFFADNELRVAVTSADGLDTVLQLGTDYTVTGADDPNGGSLVTAAAWDGTYLVTIYREVIATQLTVYEENADFPAKSHERALDKLTMLAQQLLRKLGNCIRTSETDGAIGPLPMAFQRANQLFGFDGDGNPAAFLPASGTATDLGLSLINGSDGSKGDAMLAVRQPYTGAIARTQHAKNSEVLSVRDFGAVCDGVTDDTVAVQLAITAAENAGKMLLIDGVCKTSDELIIRKPLKVQGVGSGMSALAGDTPLLTYVQRSGLLVTGTGTQRVRTRHKWRGQISDPKDDAISCALNVQAPMVEIQNLCIWLDFDRTDLTPTNYGANWDVGVFVGCRTDFKMIGVDVLGYWRLAGLYLDETHASTLPRFNDPSGIPYNNTQNISGADGLYLDRCQFRGGKWGFVALGPQTKPALTVTDAVVAGVFKTTTAHGLSVGKTFRPQGFTNLVGLTENTQYFIKTTPGFDTFTVSATNGGTEIAATANAGTGSIVLSFDQSYYDEETGLITDGRGGFGISDLTVIGCAFFGTDHHSNRRRNDASGNYLTDTAAGGCMWLGGRGAGNFDGAHGMRFFSSRFASFEPFTIKLDRVTRVLFFGCHMESRANTTHVSTTGMIIDYSDFAQKYGFISATLNTNRITRIGDASSITNHFGVVIPNAVLFNEAFAAVGSLSRFTDALMATGFRATTGEADFRSATSSDAIRWRNGAMTAGILTQTALTLTPSLIQLSTTGPIITHGSGSPEGVVAAKAGSIYANDLGGVGTSTYYKSTTTGNTGWVALT